MAWTIVEHACVMDSRGDICRGSIMISFVQSHHIPQGKDPTLEPPNIAIEVEVDLTVLAVWMMVTDVDKAIEIAVVLGPVVKVPIVIVAVDDLGVAKFEEFNNEHDLHVSK